MALLDSLDDVDKVLEDKTEEFEAQRYFISVYVKHIETHEKNILKLLKEAHYYLLSVIPGCTTDKKKIVQFDNAVREAGVAFNACQTYFEQIGEKRKEISSQSEAGNWLSHLVVPSVMPTGEYLARNAMLGLALLLVRETYTWIDGNLFS